jgi:hypothetical protein
MGAPSGIEQRSLRRFGVRWGAELRRHDALVPLFDEACRVLGLVGLDVMTGVTWYPGVPLTVERRALIFKVGHLAAPPAWSEVPPGLLERCGYFDRSGLLAVLMALQPGAPSLAGALNLAGRRIGEGRVVDAIYEPTLHRVRALALRGRWGRVRRVSILRLPGLAAALRAGPQRAALSAPMVVPLAGRPGAARRLVRLLRRLPRLPDAPRQR